MTSTTPISGANRTAPRLRLALCAAVVALVASACVPPPPSGGGSATYREGRCQGNEGVTVVVDLVGFEDRTIVRCALGPQTSGFAVLDAARLSHDPGNHPGTVCQLEELPSQGHPYCWTTGGFWSYWKAPAAGASWSFSEWGAGAGPSPAPGAVEGWRFAPFSAGTAVPPRVGTSGPIVP